MISACFRRLFSKPCAAQDVRTILQKAEGGNAAAQFVMGLKLSVGAGNDDQPQAAHWYRQAALQNHLLAQYNLAIMLARGQGIARDDAESAAWLSRAAYGGDAGAQFQMGQRLSRAVNEQPTCEAKETRIEAYKWFQLAAKQGYMASVANAERITFAMAVADVTNGNQRVTDFVPTLN